MNRAVLLVLVLVPMGLRSQATAAACAAPGFRQFDFWIGRWEVRRPNGRLAGTNTVRRTLSGCVIEEFWRGENGMAGRSLNFYRPITGEWHQVWVDDEAGFLLLRGRFADGVMRLEGEMPGPGGTLVRHRLSWTRTSDGGVRQRWEESSDGGRSWRVLFDGIYTRAR